jgi:hypothetical protein
MKVNQADPYNTDIKHSFSRVVAKKYGVNAAIIFGYLSNRIRHSKNERDGKAWYYDSIDQVLTQFPYLKRSAVYQAIKCLTATDGLLITGNYNKKGYDRTHWYAFSSKKASTLAEQRLAYFKVEDACWLDVTKAVLLENIRYNIQENKKTNPGYCLHPMSPTELARILPFSPATIKRKLNELVEKDHELTSVTDLDSREPSKYGIRGEVTYNLDVDIVKPKKWKNPNKTAETPAHAQTGVMGGSNPNMSGSNPNADGSKPNDYTILEFPLKETVKKNLLEGETSRSDVSGDSKTFPCFKESPAEIKALFDDFKAFTQKPVSSVKSGANGSQANVPSVTSPVSPDLTDCEHQGPNAQEDAQSSPKSI